uniref:Aquaporin n=1 Tax=Graphocephala atropunctata TaxID=36148 RepID=A0A1B6LJC8_9HEMI
MDQERQQEVEEGTRDEPQKVVLSMWRADLKRPWHLAQCGVLELVATALLLFFASTSCAEFPGNRSWLQTALTYAFIYATLTQILAPITGGYVNPMVAVAFNIMGQLSWLKVLVILNCQYVGSVLGSLLYKFLTPEGVRGANLCAVRVPEEIGVTWWQTLIVESVLTFVLILVILTVNDKRMGVSAGFRPPIVGMTLAGLVVMGTAYGSGVLNPLRALGPAVVAEYQVYHLVYWGGPQIGLIVAVLMWKFILGPYKMAKQ